MQTALLQCYLHDQGLHQGKASQSTCWLQAIVCHGQLEIKHPLLARHALRFADGLTACSEFYVTQERIRARPRSFYLQAIA